MTNNTTERAKHDLPCTYFDQQKTCSICSARPAMRKTGKCAVHSTVPYEPTREKDWIDCYEGCIKHDPAARTRYLENKKAQENRETRLLEAHVELQPVAIPSMHKLMTLSRHQPEQYRKQLADICRALVESRKMSLAPLNAAIGRKGDYFRSRLRGDSPFSPQELFMLFDHLYRWDTAHDKILRQAKGKK